MSKQQKKSDPSNHQALPRIHQKILPHKRHFITFQSDYDYGDSYDVIPCLIKNPKWCHLQLKLGHTGAFKKYKQLRRAKSLRLRSLHLESFSLDSQMGEDGINGYFGELDTLSRAGHTLKNLSLSVTLDDDLVKRYNREDVYHRLEKFVKKQKHLDEFAFYNGTCNDPKRIANWVKHLERTLKVLTIENLSVDNLFTKYSFPKLETLRFEYILFYGTESSFDLSIAIKSFEQIFSLRSLQALKFVQYQRYKTKTYYEIEGEDEADEEEAEDEDDEDGEDEMKVETEGHETQTYYEIEGEDEEDEKEAEDEDDEDGEDGEDGEDEMKVETEKIEEDEEGAEDEDDEDDEDGEDEMKVETEKIEENEGNTEEEYKDNQCENYGENTLGNQAAETQKPDVEAQREKKYDMTKLQEFPIEFWEMLRETLDKNKKKPLKVKYHKQDESNIKKMAKEFERIFKELSEGQSFEYEVRQIQPFGTRYGWKSKTKTLNNFIFM